MKTIAVIGNTLSSHIAAYMLSQDNKVIHIRNETDATGFEQFRLSGGPVNGLRPFVFSDDGLLRKTLEKEPARYDARINVSRNLDWIGYDDDEVVDSDIMSLLRNGPDPKLFSAFEIEKPITAILGSNFKSGKIINVNAKLINLNVNLISDGGSLTYITSAGQIKSLRWDALFFGDYLSRLTEFLGFEEASSFMKTSARIKSVTVFDGAHFMVCPYEEPNANNMHNVLSYKLGFLDKSKYLVTTFANDAMRIHSSYERTLSVVAEILPPTTLILDHFAYQVTDGHYWLDSDIGAISQIRHLKESLLANDIYLIGPNGTWTPMLPGHQDLDARYAVLTYTTQKQMWTDKYLKTNGLWT